MLSFAGIREVVRDITSTGISFRQDAAEMNATQSFQACEDEADDAELSRLVEQYEHRVRFFARRVERRFGLDPQWSDDLISSGYWGLLKALKNRRANAHEQELSAYVSTRIEGAVIDEARRVLNRVSNHADCDPSDLDAEVALHPYGVEWDQGSVDGDTEYVADRAGRWRTIEAAVAHLTADHRHLLWAYAEGQSISEIARRDGSSAGRLQNQMTRIGRQIRARSPELRRLLRHEI